MSVKAKWGLDYEVALDVGFVFGEFILGSATNGIIGVNIIEGETSFVDITQYVQNVNINRGRSTQLEVFSAGTLTLQADDRAADRYFDPFNEASPWYQGAFGIAPRRKIKVTAGTADIFTGFIYDLDINYNEPNLSFAQIAAVDALAQLSQTTLNGFTPSQELASDRINTILDRGEVGFSTAVAPREIGTALSTLGTAPYDTGINTLQALQEVQIAENGRFFVTRTGAIRFDPRITATFATAIATLGGTATGAIPITGLENIYGAETIINRATVQIAGSTAVANAEGTASQTNYGIRAIALSNVPLATQAAATALAQDLIDIYQDPIPRFTGVSVNINALSDSDQQLISQVEIGDVVEVVKNFAAGSPATVSQNSVVEAIRHSITSDRHTINLTLAPAQILLPFFFDVDSFDSGKSFRS